MKPMLKNAIKKWTQRQHLRSNLTIRIRIEIQPKTFIGKNWQTFQTFFNHSWCDLLVVLEWKFQKNQCTKNVVDLRLVIVNFCHKSITMRRIILQFLQLAESCCFFLHELAPKKSFLIGDIKFGLLALAECFCAGWRPWKNLEWCQKKWLCCGSTWTKEEQSSLEWVLFLDATMSWESLLWDQRNKHSDCYHRQLNLAKNLELDQCTSKKSSLMKHYQFVIALQKDLCILESKQILLNAKCVQMNDGNNLGC